MKKTVMLSICGVQTYMDQDPDTIELVTEGTMEQVNGGWEISYEESALTGMEGVTTTFLVEPKKITLTRTGKLNSQMVFQEGVLHNSLYRLEFGALMITVCAAKVEANLTEDGGNINLIYSIEIEQSQAGEIEYHLQINPK